MARMLIVDDSEYFREAIIEILEGEGHTIVGQAENGIEAFEKYISLRPDIITMDVTMPVMDGIEALKSIIAHDPAAKVIMVSSSALNNKVSEALIIGAYDFLPKPFDKTKLIEIVSEIVSSAI